MTKVNRKLTTILATDCVGFSRLMEQNEELTLQNLKACRCMNIQNNLAATSEPRIPPYVSFVGNKTDGVSQQNIEKCIRITLLCGRTRLSL